MINKQALLDYLKRIDSVLPEKIMLIAIGGTAMTLMDLKPTTRDIDFCLDARDYELFKKAISKVRGKFTIHLFSNGYIFSQQLPEDYIEKSVNFRKYEKIDLRILHPLDIIITKISRLNARDEADIDTLMKTKNINKEALINRFNQVIKTHAGVEEHYKYQFNLIINKYFP